MRRWRTYYHRLPWANKFKFKFRCCIYCGGTSFWDEAKRTRCNDPNCNKTSPNISLATEAKKERTKLEKEYCDRVGIDYEKTLKSYIEALGPIWQNREDDIPTSDRDLTVYKEEEW